MPGIPCPHCQTGLSLAEAADGWCDSCGKRLPPSVQQAGLAWAVALLEQEAASTKRAFAGWIIAGIVMGLAGFITSRLLFDLPPVHGSDTSLALWLFGAPACGGILFGVSYRVLVTRYPQLVRAGLYLGGIGLFGIAGVNLVLWLASIFVN
jgi:hypothetical protein